MIIKNNKNSYRFHFIYGIILSVIICAYCVMIANKPLKMDDLTFSHELDDAGLFDVLYDKYTKWSSRLCAEFLFISITRIPLVSCLLSAFFYITTYCNLRRLLNIQKFTSETVLFLVMLIYPFFDMFSAGFMVTSIVYIWSLCAITTLFVILKREQSNNSLRFFDLLILIVCIFFSMFIEQASLVLCILLFCYILLKKYKFQIIDHIVLTIFLLSLLGLLFALLSTGNANRLEFEISHVNPLFTTYSLFDKLSLGLYRINQIFLSRGNYIMYLFSITLIALSISNTQSKNSYLFLEGKELLKCPNYLFSAVLNCCKLFLSSIHIVILIGYALARHINIVHTFIFEPSNTYIINYTWSGFLSPLFFTVLYFVSVLFNLLNNLRHKDASIIICILTAGFLSQLALGFSPTIYVSGHRTAIFMYFSMIFSLCYIFNLIIDSKWKYKKSYSYCLIILCIIMATRMTRDTIILISSY